ncbi:MAG: hypothetical protein ACRDND_29915, partial [Streptosporangiaceae bacterium]
AHRAGLEPAHAGALLARLRHLAARFRAVAGTPIPPPRPAARPSPKPAEPRFVSTHSFRFMPADPPPERSGLPPGSPPGLSPGLSPGLPRAWCWLLRLVPQAAAGRAQLEELLRDPAMVDMLAADPRLGPLLRPLGWMLGVDRALLPASRRRRRLVIVVPGGRAEVAAAAAAYAGARAKAVSVADIIALWCLPARGGRDRRPVWRGCAGLVLADGAQIPG